MKISGTKYMDKTWRDSTLKPESIQVIHVLSLITICHVYHCSMNSQYSDKLNQLVVKINMYTVWFVLTL